MFFTRTIRRKLLSTLTLVVVMLVTMTAVGVTGLQSYRSVVAEFDRILNKTLNRAHVAAGISKMLVPLRLPVSPKSPSFEREAIEQRDRFNKAEAEAESMLAQYRKRLDGLSPIECPPGQRMVLESLGYEINKGLRTLDQDKEWLTDFDEHESAVSHMLETVSDMEVKAWQMPDPAEELDKTLELARRESRSKQIIVYVVAAVAVVSLLLLIRFGYTAIFDPIRKLHQGAVRVAHGDLDFRLRVTSKDEMAELAEAFNEMTERFQEIRGDLDRQVHERSQQLVRSERLANVGFLSAGVAHEINNPLSAISMASESVAERIDPVLERMDPGEAGIIRQYLKMIQDESDRCRNITERLLDFARGRDHVREPTDLTRLIQEVISMVQHLSKFREKNIVLAPHGACFAEVNGAEIKQVVLNLIANGLDAMDRGGTLHVEISEQTDHVRLQFTDEGCGMTPEVLEQIFEPFFTKKEAGKGTGLGLSITHRIVNQHGGSIDVRSPGPGQGSTFCVRLPRRALQRGAA